MIAKETAEDGYKDNWIKIIAQNYDFKDYDPLDLKNHPGDKTFTLEELKGQIRDNLNFRAVDTIHEDAKGVWFRDYMWF